MSVKFRIPYQCHFDTRGVLCTSAMVKVRLGTKAEPGWTDRFDALIDSGAHRCIFNSDLAELVGLDLRSGRAEQVRGIGGSETVWFHDVSMQIATGTFTVEAAFQENLPVSGILGMNGFFDHHIVTFRPDVKAVELERVFTT